MESTVQTLDSKAERRTETDRGVLYVHVGPPKTGTTSLQAFLIGNEDELSRRGYIYPDRWRKIGPHGTPTLGHHLAAEILEGDGAVASEIIDHLSQAPQPNTIISTEALAAGLKRQYLPAMVRFLDSCNEFATPKVILVARRVDAHVNSWYLHQLKKGKIAQMSLDQAIERRLNWTESLFQGVQELRQLDRPWSLEIVPFIEGENSVPYVVKAMDLDVEALDTRPPEKLKRKLGLKAQAILSLPNDRLREATRMSRGLLRSIFESNGFEFPGESYSYDVIGYDNRVRMHQKALELAERYGVPEYVAAFGSDEIKQKEWTPLDPSLVSEEDLDALREYKRSVGGRELRRAKKEKKA